MGEINKKTQKVDNMNKLNHLEKIIPEYHKTGSKFELIIHG